MLMAPSTKKILLGQRKYLGLSINFSSTQAMHTYYIGM